jgi:hypothetical protein
VALGVFHLSHVALLIEHTGAVTVALVDVGFVRDRVAGFTGRGLLVIGVAFLRASRDFDPIVDGSEGGHHQEEAE